MNFGTFTIALMNQLHDTMLSPVYNYLLTLTFSDPELLIDELTRFSSNNPGYFGDITVTQGNVCVENVKFNHVCNIPLGGDYYTRATMIAFCFYGIGWTTLLPDLGKQVSKRLKDRDRGFVFDHNVLIKFLATNSSSHIVFYDNKFVELIDLQNNDNAFKLACYRVRDNSNHGYVKTPNGSFYKISRQSKMATKTTPTEILATNGCHLPFVR